jgi:hypothetical protein
MPDSAEHFFVDLEAATQALVLAEAAARKVLELLEDAPSADLHMALFRVPTESGGAPPEADDATAVVEFMDRQLVADHGAAGTSVRVEALGYSRKEITRLKAFGECVRTGVDPYAAILTKQKFDGATRSYGSRLFGQITPDGTTVPLIAAASGWRGDQDYAAVMMVPATLQCVLLEFGVLPRDVIVSSAFVLASGAWEYPAR